MGTPVGWLLVVLEALGCVAGLVPNQLFVLHNPYRLYQNLLRTRLIAFRRSLWSRCC